MEHFTVSVPRLGARGQSNFTDEDRFPMVMWEINEVFTVAANVQRLSLLARRQQGA